MRMTKLRNAFTVLALAIAMVGCANLGQEKPESFKQQLAYASGVNKAIVDAVASAVPAGSLTSSEGDDVLKKADNAHALLVIANNAYAAGDQAGAQNALVIALSALTALQDYLRAHGATQ
jgi:hypothetical protein